MGTFVILEPVFEYARCDIDLTKPEQIEQLRRRVAILGSSAPALVRDDAMQVLAALGQLANAAQSTSHDRIQEPQENHDARAQLGNRDHCARVADSIASLPLALIPVSASEEHLSCSTSSRYLVVTASDLRPCIFLGLAHTIVYVKELLPHRWKLTFETLEDEDHCEMVVHLDAGDRSLSGYGRSRRNPEDPSVPQVGEELAAARALTDLANHLTEDAWSIIESFPANVE